MNRSALLLLTLLSLTFTVSAAPDKIVKESITSQGQKRTYYLYVPESVKPPTAPLVVLLHGSNRNGLSLVEKWKDLAQQEGFILAGPDSADPASWNVPVDGPDFLRELVESLKARYPINPRRVYLFGHSGGATFALLMAVYEPEYFAATAIHAGALNSQTTLSADQPRRKTPIFIQVGTNDALFPLTVVRATRDTLTAQGFPTELKEIPGHDHWYYDLAPQINASAWEFLKRYELAAEPRYEQHLFGSGGKNAREANEAYNRGLERHRAGKLDEAIAAYTRALERDTNFADAYNNRGVAYMSQLNYAAAVSDFSRSIEIKPTDAAYANRGSAQHALKKLTEAVADFSHAIEMKPTAEVFYQRGFIYEEKGTADLALADYTRAIELNSRFAPAYANRGIIRLRRGEDAEAQRDLDTAFQLDGKLRAELEPYIKQVRAARGTKQP